MTPARLLARERLSGPLPGLVKVCGGGLGGYGSARYACERVASRRRLLHARDWCRPRSRAGSNSRRRSAFWHAAEHVTLPRFVANAVPQMTQFFVSAVTERDRARNSCRHSTQQAT